eukprot:Gregarina_sp_Poly_1__3835@NODE_2142_length_2611_cov_31_959119_g1380_i0_p3_GENE_NODE_2142_length_2611_cov_31_959119_g1380_i0NODE_2142_length_2611_cov_31_959119_g1380_i0_p3_ORF_typecomplete_len205_score29_79_NODE_2142_length_2611_cov_31_959119_g1380_i09781592
MGDRPPETFEVIRGEPQIIGENQTRQKIYEIPETEIHHIVQPGRKIIDHTVENIPGTVWKDIIDYDSGSQKCAELLNTKYVEKVIVKKVDQLIEVPREVEEVVYVDEPVYEIVEVPEYYPVVVSKRIQPRVDESKVKIVEDVCWIPHVVYDATKDPRRPVSKRASSSVSDASRMNPDVKFPAAHTSSRKSSAPIQQTVTQVAYT